VHGGWRACWAEEAANAPSDENMYTKIHEGTEWDAILIKLTAFVAIAGVFGILAWIDISHNTTTKTDRRDKKR